VVVEDLEEKADCGYEGCAVADGALAVFLRCSKGEEERS
jgi:hypothetical protein